MKQATFIPIASSPVLLCFNASYSGSCHLLQPIIKDLREDYEGKLKVLLLEKGEDLKGEALYEIDFFPTILLLWEDKVVIRIPGLVSRKELYHHVDQLLTKIETHHKK